MIDRDSPVAPYEQIAAILREGIADGTYQPGRSLPTITRLVQEYCVARTTAAKALKLLIDEGLAISRHGMGTCVRPD